MGSWRDQILKEFTPKVSRLTLVADPDGLLLEEGILEGIRERGFELIPFEDHVAFRYAYESGFRSRWDRGEQTDLVVVLHSQASDLSGLPFDLLQAGRRLSFNLGDIFPNLSSPVLSALDRGDLDALYDAQERHAPGQLGDNATKDFILRNVFEISPELIKQPSDLLRVLLRRHYLGQHIPDILDERFIQILKQSDIFNDWPLETIILDRKAFFSFLQERWPVFLNRVSARENISLKDDKQSYLPGETAPKASGLAISGPAEIPFDHQDIRVYIDTLFLERLLQPVPHEQNENLSKTWVRIGLRTDSQEDREQRLNRLIQNIRSSIPVDSTRHKEWFHFSRRWAELLALIHDPGAQIREKVKEEIKTLMFQIDDALTGWVTKRYAGLINLPPVPPVMLHHVPRFLSRYLEEDRNQKVALVMVDGLSLDQWIVLRDALSEKSPAILFRESSVFAWIPTITSISRQAAFSGKSPLYFPNSIYTTDKEPALWTQFWEDQGLKQHEIVYVKGLGDGSLAELEELLTYPDIKVAGLVIDKIDRIMHGMELGAAGMHNQIHQWANQPYLANLLDLLLDQRFRVFLTSDHGNIEAEGCGRPSEGALADLRGERVRIYSDRLLRKKVQEKYYGCLAWESIGVPEDYLALLAPSRKAFVRKGERIVSHGGLSVEELIVPFIQIERKGL
jgi:hypothetical protein